MCVLPIHLMSYVFEHPEEAHEKGLWAAADMLANWTWRQAAEKIKARLLAINEAR